MICPVVIAVVATFVPTTAGSPSSRATIAVWESTPPTSDTTAPAIESNGTQGGNVISTTMISPSSSSAVAWLSERQTRAGPVKSPGEPATPLSTFGSVLSSVGTTPSSRDTTASMNGSGSAGGGGRVPSPEGGLTVQAR